MAPLLLAARAARTARRVYPLAVAAYERWQSLSPQDKERYREKARAYAAQGRRLTERPGARRPGGRGRRG